MEAWLKAKLAQKPELCDLFIPECRWRSGGGAIFPFHRFPLSCSQPHVPASSGWQQLYTKPVQSCRKGGEKGVSKSAKKKVGGLDLLKTDTHVARFSPKRQGSRRDWPD